MSNKALYSVEEKLVTYVDRFRGTKMESIFRDLLEQVRRGIAISERQIDDAFNGALRNSEFPGDLVGRLDDDFAD